MAAFPERWTGGCRTWPRSQIESLAANPPRGSRAHGGDGRRLSGNRASSAARRAVEGGRPFLAVGEPQTVVHRKRRFVEVIDEQADRRAIGEEPRAQLGHAASRKPAIA